jgi:hypothetical protein
MSEQSMAALVPVDTETGAMIERPAISYEGIGELPSRKPLFLPRQPNPPLSSTERIISPMLLRCITGTA